jgi:hypothetical protein
MVDVMIAKEKILQIGIIDRKGIRLERNTSKGNIGSKKVKAEIMSIVERFTGILLQIGLIETMVLMLKNTEMLIDRRSGMIGSLRRGMSTGMIVTEITIGKIAIISRDRDHCNKEAVTMLIQEGVTIN